MCANGRHRVVRNRVERPGAAFPGRGVRRRLKATRPGIGKRARSVGRPCGVHAGRALRGASGTCRWMSRGERLVAVGGRPARAYSLARDTDECLGQRRGDGKASGLGGEGRGEPAVPGPAQVTSGGRDVGRAGGPYAAGIDVGPGPAASLGGDSKRPDLRAGVEIDAGEFVGQGGRRNQPGVGAPGGAAPSRRRGVVLESRRGDSDSIGSHVSRPEPIWIHRVGRPGVDCGYLSCRRAC
jgi:hypothetical protein